MRWERRSPPIEQGEISPLALKRATQRTALAMLTPKRLAAALRDMPPSTAPTTRSRRSTESAIPAASCARRQSLSRSKLIRESIPRFNSLGDRSRPTGAPKIGRTCRIIGKQPLKLRERLGKSQIVALVDVYDRQDGRR